MKRNISGVLLLDKPIGPSSNEALQKVKHLFRASRAGHTGSLDPKASGMLPICFGEATKFTRFLLEADKRYVVTGKLGESTASGDSETPVIATGKVDGIDLARVHEVLAKFRGKIVQTPPMYSALKYQGQPLYRLARQGIEVTRSPREVTIFSLELVELRDNFLSLHVLCSKGTYVRTLIADIGEFLGCGAHVVALRRLSVGQYQEAQMLSLEHLEELMGENNMHRLEQLLLPMDSMVTTMPAVNLTADMLYYARLGNALLVPQAPTSGLVRIYHGGDRFCGIGEILPDGKMVPRKMCR